MISSMIGSVMVASLLATRLAMAWFWRSPGSLSAWH